MYFSNFSFPASQPRLRPKTCLGGIPPSHPQYRKRRLIEYQEICLGHPPIHRHGEGGRKRTDLEPKCWGTAAQCAGYYRIRGT